MPKTTIVCVMYLRFPDHSEPLGGFVEHETTAKEIDQWLRSQPGGLIGTWEDFEVKIDAPNQMLYAVFTGTPDLPMTADKFRDPICHGVYTSYEAAEQAIHPKRKWWKREQYDPGKFVLPFRLGWKNAAYFPEGKPWPPDQL